MESLTKILREINRRGTTILLVEQILEVAPALSHRLYVMDQGRIQFEWDARGIARRPRHPAALPGRLAADHRFHLKHHPIGRSSYGPSISPGSFYQGWQFKPARWPCRRAGPKMAA